MGNQQINFGFRIPEELLNKLKYIAEKDCRSTGSMVRILIYDFVEKFEQEHGQIE